MKKLVLSVFVFIFIQAVAFAQGGLQIEGEEVFRNDDVVFHQLDEHTWVGTGNLSSNESVYLIEGEDRAALIDAGTDIAGLDEILATMTDKPIMMIATHAHPDHVGSVDYFDEVHINPADEEGFWQFKPDYQGELIFLEEGQVIDLGGRYLEVVFTPAHTPGSTSFIDYDADYGFSGDSFGSGNLLMFGGTFTDLLESATKMSNIMEEDGVEFLYPGHYNGRNPETQQRINDLITISRDVLSGDLAGEEVEGNRFGFNYTISGYGVRISYSEEAVQ